MQRNNLAKGLLAIVLASLAAGPARAAEATGTVVALDDDDLVIDLGEGAVSVGDVVELWRPLKLKHPVTGKVLTDRFKIGAIEITQVRPSMSLGKASGELARDAQKGDLVIVAPAATHPPASPPAPKAEEKPAVAAPSSVPPSPASPPPAPSWPLPSEPEARAIDALLGGLSNADPRTRAARYDEYVRARPGSPYATILREEAAALRRADGARRPHQPELDEDGHLDAPRRAIAGRPLALGVELSSAAKAAVLHARHAGEPAYRSYPMSSRGDGYFEATLPPEQMAAGDVEYFVEAVGAKGEARPAIGSPATPRAIDVAAPPRTHAPAPPLGTASVLADYADYNRLRGNDRVFLTEGFFGMRFGDTGVRALRSGFGVYRGVGGSLAELDEQNKPGRNVGLTYGWLEGELGIVPELSLGARVAIGLLDDGVSGGGQLLVRIGNDRRTNLQLGGEVLGGVGLKTFVALELATFERFPILLRTEVTNQPAGSSSLTAASAGQASDAGEIGARGIAQLGFRPVRSLVLSARGSVQGRNIRHAGPGFGGGVTYEW